MSTPKKVSKWDASIEETEKRDALRKKHLEDRKREREQRLREGNRYGVVAYMNREEAENREMDKYRAYHPFENHNGTKQYSFNENGTFHLMYGPGGLPVFGRNEEETARMLQEYDNAAKEEILNVERNRNKGYVYLGRDAKKKMKELHKERLFNNGTTQSLKNQIVAAGPWSPNRITKTLRNNPNLNNAMGPNSNWEPTVVGIGRGPGPSAPRLSRGGTRRNRRTSYRKKRRS